MLRGTTVTSLGEVQIDTTYPLTVVIATTTGWPTMRVSLDAVLPQVRAVDGQLIVADSSGKRRPEWSHSPDVAWLERPGESVFRLRREGYARARGSIVAATEDHCQPHTDWAGRILAAHARAPEAAAIGGAVENGTQDHLIDWAIYLVTQLPWTAPLPSDAERVAGHTNISYKRWALAEMPADGPLTIEILFNAHLRATGRTVIADDTIRVRHFQCMGTRRTSALEFHNGRSIGGLRRGSMAAADWVRTAAPGPAAGYRLARTLGLALAKPIDRSIVLRALPYVAWLHAVHAVGESVGYLVGPGDSPSRLH